MSCSAICRNGNKCSFKAKQNSLCGMHINKIVPVPVRKCVGRDLCADIPLSNCELCFTCVYKKEKLLHLNYFDKFNIYMIGEVFEIEAQFQIQHEWSFQELMMIYRNIDGYPSYVHCGQLIRQLEETEINTLCNNLNIFTKQIRINFMLYNEEDLHEQAQSTNVVPIARQIACVPCSVEGEVAGLIKKMGKGRMFSHEKLKETLAEEIECVVCKMNKKEFAFIECGHLCVCVNCVPNDKKCPLCREVSQNIKRIFF